MIADSFFFLYFLVSYFGIRVSGLDQYVRFAILAAGCSIFGRCSWQ